MNKTTVLVVVGIAAAAFIAVPALKGPVNRWRLEANEKLNAEYVVDNYKAEYVALHEKRTKVNEAIQKFTIEKTVAEKKLALAEKEAEAAKSKLIAAGASDLKKFAAAKDLYESLRMKAANFKTMSETYAKAVKQLEQSLALIDTNMAKAQRNVDMLSSKKTMLDTVKSVNKSIESLNGVGDTEIAVNVEKLDDDMLRESVKLDALSDNSKPSVQMTEADAKAYLDSLK